MVEVVGSPVWALGSRGEEGKGERGKRRGEERGGEGKVTGVNRTGESMGEEGKKSGIGGWRGERRGKSGVE
eukprot:2915115-Rhodomonas_salina.1